MMFVRSCVRTSLLAEHEWLTSTSLTLQSSIWLQKDLTCSKNSTDNLVLTRVLEAHAQVTKQQQVLHLMIWQIVWPWPTEYVYIHTYNFHSECPLYCPRACRHFSDCVRDQYAGWFETWQRTCWPHRAILQGSKSMPRSVDYISGNNTPPTACFMLELVAGCKCCSSTDWLVQPQHSIFWSAAHNTMLVMNISESDVHITASSTVCCDLNVFNIQVIPGLVHLWDLVSAGLWCDVCCDMPSHSGYMATQPLRSS